MTVVESARSIVNVHGVDVEIETCGAGPAILLLPSEEQLESGGAFVAELARAHRVVIASPPGFGRSGRPDWIVDPDDLSYVMLDLAEMLDLEEAALVGASLGGWIAAEMATKDTSLFSRVALIGAYGVKIGGPTDVDIQDVWRLHPDKVAAMKWRDQAKGQRDYAAMSDDELAVVARNLESFARFCWEPYMHNPSLKHRLHRIAAPALVLWGENDGITTPDYGRAYAGLIPGAEFRTIAEAGHFPHVEQPEAAARALRAFLA
ncbi:MAG TPA: alpha/beta hydrolase [Beijerinckiaceae bacterium]|jgi:pimeloyl-ACP methyl ester carboxylesterase